MMKRIKKTLFLIILVFSFSCEKQGLFVKCSDCTAEEPVTTELNVKLDDNTNSYGVPTLINVYEGNLEDNVLYHSYNVSGSSTTIPVSLNKKYTVTATYYISASIYVTVDSATPKVKYTRDQCNDPCYFVYDREIDLRLKHTK
jgi:hypothetical protein